MTSKRVDRISMTKDLSNNSRLNLSSVSKFKFNNFKDWFHYSLTFSPDIVHPSKMFNKRDLGKFNIYITPMQYLYFNIDFLWNNNKQRAKYYEPDFYYSFGYDNPHDNTWGFKYENYENNRFNSDGDPYASHFDDGTWEIHYKTRFKDIPFKLFASYRPSLNYKIVGVESSFDIKDSTTIRWKYEHYLTHTQDRLEVAFKTYIKDKFFVEAGIHLYSDKSKQESYEDDYYYSFGWEDYRAKHFSFVFTNRYDGTRFPWRKEKGNPFTNGHFNIIYHF